MLRFASDLLSSHLLHSNPRGIQPCRSGQSRLSLLRCFFLHENTDHTISDSPISSFGAQACGCTGFRLLRCFVLHPMCSRPGHHRAGTSQSHSRDGFHSCSYHRSATSICCANLSATGECYERGVFASASPMPSVIRKHASAFQSPKQSVTHLHFICKHKDRTSSSQLGVVNKPAAMASLHNDD